MTKQKKELLNDFCETMEDIMDNYEEYTTDEQAKVKKIFEDCKELNKLLDKYDNQKWYKKIGKHFEKLARSFSSFFGGNK